MSTALDFTMIANNDVNIQFTVVDANGTAVPITGATIKWEARRRTGETAVITKTTSSGITITNGAGGIFSVGLDAADTLSLSGNYIHEAVVTLSGDAVTLTNTDVTHGTMTVRAQNTAQ